MAHGIDRRLGPSGHTHLRQQRRDVVLDRLLGEVETFADLAVCQALRQQFENIALLFGEPGKALVLLGPPPDAFEHPRGQHRVEKALAGSHPPHRVDQVGRPDLLQDVPGRAGHDRLEQRFVIRERREDETPGPGMERTDLAARLNPVSFAETNVEDGNIGVERMNARNGLLLRARLTYHFDVAL